MTTSDTMMIDSAEGSARRWVNDDIDALPYADQLPEGWRTEVDQLIQEEVSGGVPQAHCALVSLAISTRDGGLFASSR